jgi:hypothetical protein
MGKCNDCRFWEKTSEVFGTGSCKKLKTESGMMKGSPYTIVDSSRPDNGNVVTFEDFGCVNFEEKPKCAEGPFKVVCCFGAGSPATYQVRYAGNSEYAPIIADKQKRAESCCDWLNKLWAQRELSANVREKSCLECTHFGPGGSCHSFFSRTTPSRLYCVLFRWRDCGNCGTYAHGCKYGRVCDEWSPK